MIFRRFLLPAIVAVPLWYVSLFFFLQKELPGAAEFPLSILLIGAAFDLVGILLICIPSARVLRNSSLSTALRALAMIGAGAVGGYVLISLYWLIASFPTQVSLLDGDTWRFGLLGAFPGAITTAVWLLFNPDLIQVAKDFHRV